MREALRRDRAAIVVVVAFIVLIGGMVGYNAYATDRERPTPLVVDVTARQRTLVERYVKDVVLKLDGVAADPAPSAKILRTTADALLDGGKVVSPQGSLDQFVTIPAATNSAVRLEARARTQADRRAARHAARRCSPPVGPARPSSPTCASCASVGAELSSVTGDAAGEITKVSQTSLSRLVQVEIVLGLAVGALALAMGVAAAALRPSASRPASVRSCTTRLDLITVARRARDRAVPEPVVDRACSATSPAEIVGTKLTELLHPTTRTGRSRPSPTCTSSPARPWSCTSGCGTATASTGRHGGHGDEPARRPQRPRLRRELA